VGGAAPAGSVISTLPECQFVRFEDFSIDGNKANQTDAGVDGGQCGIYTASGNNLIMKNLWIQNVIREGIYPHEYSSYIENVYITNCDRAGFAIDGNRYTTLMNCYAYYNGTEDYAASGFYIVGGGSPNDDSHSAITNCHTYQNFGSGINITNCKNFSAIGNILLEDGTNAGAEFATQRSSLAVVTSKFIVLMGNHCKYSTWNGIHFDTSDNCVIQGNICIGNGGNAHTGVDSSGISITGGGHTISGNQCTDDQVAKQQTYGISLNGASVINCSVIGNYAKGNTADSVLQNGIGAGNDINHNIT
jgi:parallel beta-helix repeat protein